MQEEKWMGMKKGKDGMLLYICHMWMKYQISYGRKSHAAPHCTAPHHTTPAVPFLMTWTRNPHETNLKTKGIGIKLSACETRYSPHHTTPPFLLHIFCHYRVSCIHTPPSLSTRISHFVLFFSEKPLFSFHLHQNIYFTLK